MNFFPVSHFLDDEKKYKLLASCFPSMKQIAPPTGEHEEVHSSSTTRRNMVVDVGEAYEDESDSDEGHGSHGSHVQCAQSNFQQKKL
ncbi:unnamed protein product, partial [Mesorhabditis belari]|uniref:Uncharacterized protein n=1 Tax=Mesorhabditis belari TaxID=2138241 RepID=A0AAF3EIQ6_9BILA